MVLIQKTFLLTCHVGVGNIPANMNPAILRSIFQPFGPIESVRVLSHKNCGFVNFEHQEDAVRARKSLQNKEILGPGTGTVRIGFAKVPANNADESDDANNSSQQAMPTPDNYQATQWATAMMMSKMLMQTSENQDEQPDLQTAIDAERRFIMQQLGVDVPEGFQGKTITNTACFEKRPLIINFFFAKTPLTLNTLPIYVHCLNRMPRCDWKFSVCER